MTLCTTSYSLREAKGIYMTPWASMSKICPLKFTIKTWRPMSFLIIVVRTLNFCYWATTETPKGWACSVSLILSSNKNHIGGVPHIAYLWGLKPAQKMTNCPTKHSQKVIIPCAAHLLLPNRALIQKLEEIS